MGRYVYIYICEEEKKQKATLFGIVPGTGGCQNRLGVSFSLGKKEHINNNSKKILGKMPGQSWDNPVNNLFMCLLVYFPTLIVDYSYSVCLVWNQIVLQLQQQVDFPENSVIAVTD